MYKGIVYFDRSDKAVEEPERFTFVNIGPEKEAIQSFLNSPTALAYGAFAFHKSCIALREEKGELWRLFFYQVNRLLLIDDPMKAAILAREIEISYFAGLSEEDLGYIVESFSNLPAALENVSTNADLHILALDELALDQIPDEFKDGLPDELNNDLVEACAGYV